MTAERVQSITVEKLGEQIDVTVFENPVLVLKNLQDTLSQVRNVGLPHRAAPT
jgi:hypothetical protein